MKTIIRRGFLGEHVAIVLVAVTMLPGCFQHYFRTNTQTKINKPIIDSLISLHKYFVIHFENRVAGLENVSVSEDKLDAILMPLPGEHSKYLLTRQYRTNQVKRKDKKDALTEVHLYTKQSTDSNKSNISVPLSSFSMMDVYTPDKTTTTANHVLSWIGVTMGLAFVALMILYIGSGGYP